MAELEGLAEALVEEGAAADDVAIGVVETVVLEYEDTTTDDDETKGDVEEVAMTADDEEITEDAEEVATAADELRDELELAGIETEYSVFFSVVEDGELGTV